MDEITIQRLSPETAQLLTHVAEEVFDAPPRQDYTAAFLASPDHRMLLAVAGGEQVVGMCSAVFYYHPDKPRQMWINEVGVGAAWRQKGIALRLVQQMLALAWEADCDSVWLGTEVENLPARALYRRAEARETEGLVIYYWDEED